MSHKPSLPVVVNVADAEEIEHMVGDRWGGTYRVLTPSMRPSGGSLGVNRTRVPPGRALCPFHYHQREDEVFFVLSGRGVLRYGAGEESTLVEVGPGDCMSFPAGTGVAHQIANPFDVDLIYLAIGPNDPDEVAVYPDNGKVMVRSLQTVGRLERRPYMDGEPDRPRIFDLLEEEAS